jgi:hypothetical protein
MLGLTASGTSVSLLLWQAATCAPATRQAAVKTPRGLLSTYQSDPIDL